ncbi:MAG: tripartite tricarboxylate transporter substrate binding protein [Lawsonibacter sp.]|nr:tripartite tricarboxylate transporter substrate binding protein [Lawsonibacter sp.]
MKKILAGILAAAMAVSLAACGSPSSAPGTPAASTPAASTPAASTPAAPAPTGTDYPTKNIQGSIMWSAGGVCDIVSRAAGLLAQEELGQTIVFTNRAGSGGGVSTAYVNAQAADGYELLFGAENPQIAKVMGTSELDYEDFYPINLLCNSFGGIFVAKDSKYQTIQDLIEDLKANPGQRIMASTGAGGLPETVFTMMKSISGVDATMVPFDGENECATNVMGGNADFGISTLGSIASFYQSGDLRILAMFHNERLEGFDDVPAITEAYSEYNDVLPWGPFYGVFVKNGTDQAIIDTLTAAFSKACEDQSFKDTISSKGCFIMNMTGDEAVEYLAKYRATTSYMLYDSGVAAIDPASVGITR